MKLKRYEIDGVAAFAATALAAATLAAPPASAAVTSIESSSTPLDVALTVSGQPVDIGPLRSAAVSVPPPPVGGQGNGAASFSTTVGPLSVTSGQLGGDAAGDTIAATGAASSSIDSLSIALASTANLTAGLVSSSSSVTGTSSPTGSTTLADLTIEVLGASVPIPVNPSPNTVIYDFGGLTITANQQIADKTVNGDHITEGITTNALAFDFAGFPGVSGSIDIGQSAASISETVPEPSTWAMMALGFVGLAFVSWRGPKLAAIC
jgi:PEP-CTERM motif